MYYPQPNQGKAPRFREQFAWSSCPILLCFRVVLSAPIKKTKPSLWSVASLSSQNLQSSENVSFTEAVVQLKIAIYSKFPKKIRLKKEMM